MPLVPYQRLTIESALPIDELQRRLSDSVEPKKFFRLSRDHKPYEGEVGPDGFRINRIIHYRNSFLPRVTGTIAAVPGGSQLQATLTLHVAVGLFVLFWCGTVGVLAAKSLPSTHVSPAALIPLGMLTFMYLLTVGAFSFEARKTRRFLEGLAEATPRLT